MSERADWYSDYGPGEPTPGPEHGIPGVLERSVSDAEAGLRRSTIVLRWEGGHLKPDIAFPRLEEWSRGLEPDALIPDEAIRGKQ